MPRPRAFDPQKVQFAAANLFRQRGYRDVSIADLEAATGLVSGSLYNAYGDKAGLFRAALRTYIDAFVAPRLTQNAGESARLEDLERLFLSILEPPLDDGYGCLVNNSLVEFGPGGGLASEAIAETLTLVQAAIASVLTREIGPEAAAQETPHLMMLYHGILTLSRGPMPMEVMHAATRAQFRRLIALRDP